MSVVFTLRILGAFVSGFIEGSTMIALIDFVSETGGAVEFLPAVLGQQVLEHAVASVVAGGTLFVLWIIWRKFVNLVVDSWTWAKSTGYGSTVIGARVRDGLIGGDHVEGNCSPASAADLAAAGPESLPRSADWEAGYSGAMFPSGPDPDQSRRMAYMDGKRAGGHLSDSDRSTYDW